jgi:hypothetical protein
MVDTWKSRFGQGPRTWVVVGLFERWVLEC